MIRPSVYSPAQPFAPQLRYRSTAKSSKLQSPKICVVGCEVLRRGWRLKVRSKLGLGAKPATPCLARIGSTAKSIAPCRMHLQKKKLHGGLRCDMRGWHLMSAKS